MSNTQVTTVPDRVISLVSMVNGVSHVLQRRTITPSEKQSIRRQLPAISKLLVEAHGDVLQWFGGSDVWDGMCSILKEAKQTVRARK